MELFLAGFARSRKLELSREHSSDRFWQRTRSGPVRVGDFRGITEVHSANSGEFVFLLTILAHEPHLAGRDPEDIAICLPSHVPRLAIGKRVGGEGEFMPQRWAV